MAVFNTNQARQFYVVDSQHPVTVNVDDKKSVLEGLDKVLSDVFRKLSRNVVNPYDKDNSVENIYKVICNIPLEYLKQKHFFDLK